MTSDIDVLRARIARLEAENKRLQQDVKDVTTECQQLRARDEQRRALLDATPDLLFRIGADGTYRDVHAGGHELAMPKEFIIGTNIRDTPLPSAVVEQTERALQATLETGAQQRFSYILDLPEQGRRHYQTFIVRSGPDEVLCVVRDQTEEVAAKHEAEAREQFVRNIASTLPGILYVYDLEERRNVFINHEVWRVLGYTEADVADWSEEGASALMHPEDRARHEAHYAELATMPDGTAQAVEYRMKARDGTWRWLYTTNSVMSRTTDGGIQRIVGVAQDITDRKAMEQELQESQAFIKQVTDAVPSILYIYDLIEQQNVFLNRNVAAILGYDAAEIAEMGDQMLPQLMHPEDRALVAEHFQQIAQMGDAESRTVEYRMRTKAGAWRWMLSTDIIHKRLADGTPHQIVGTAQDITERKVVEEALQLKTAEFEAIFQALPDAVLFTDVERKVRMVNPAFTRMYGYTQAEVEGESVAMFYVNQDEFEHQGQKRFNRDADSHFEPYEASYVRKDGTRFISETVATVVKDNRETVVGYVGMMRDVTEKKEAEQALHESQQFVQLINDTVPNVIYVFDVLAQKNIYGNPATERVLGFTAEEIQAMGEQGVVPQIHADDLERVAAHQAKISTLADGMTCAVEYRYRHKAGHWVWLLSTDTIMKRLPDGTAHHILGVAQDITARKQVEEALRASEERYRSLYNNTPVMLHSIDAQGRLVSVSDYWLQKMGYTRDEVLGQRSTAFLTKASRAYAIEEVLPAFLREGYCQDVPYQFMRKDGRPIDVLLSGIAERDADGQILRSLAVIVDVTERKRAEQALQASEERYRTLYNKTPVMLHSIDTQGRLVSVSDYWLQKMGYTREEVLGRRSVELLTAADQELAKTRIPQFLKDGYSVDLPYHFIKADGEVLDVLLSALVEYKADGTVQQAMAVLTDVTERNKAQAERERYAAQLEATNKELEQFAYVASHDLQEPLRTITSFIKLLEQDYGAAFAGAGAEYMHFITDASARMRQLIQDLLTYSRAGQWAVNREQADLNQVLTDVQLGLSVAIEEAEATITVEPLPTLYVDPTMMRLLFQNLLSNALKFRRDEPLQIHVYAEQLDAYWKICVADNGIGIKERYLERIFEIFRRLHGQGRYSGTGIGLAICKKIAERHGGTIGVTSVVNKGSTFYMTLPQAFSP